MPYDFPMMNYFMLFLFTHLPKNLELFEIFCILTAQILAPPSGTYK